MRRRRADRRSGQPPAFTARPAAADSGQATVEFVLVLPVLVTFVMLVLQVGLVARDRVLLVHAAREAARAAAVDPDPQTAGEAARAATGLESERLDVELGPERGRGDRLVVRVGYRSPTDLPIIGLLLPDVAQSSEVTIRVE